MHERRGEALTVCRFLRAKMRRAKMLHAMFTRSRYVSPRLRHAAAASDDMPIFAAEYAFVMIRYAGAFVVVCRFVAA